LICGNILACQKSKQNHQTEKSGFSWD